MIALALALVTAQAQPSVDLRSLSTPDIISRGRASVANLGAYKVKLAKEERIGDRLQEPQIIQLWVRESPHAVRAEYIGGNATGRKALYDSQARPNDVRVKEHGVLGIAGPVWIGIRSSLALGDTNHDMTEAGFGAILRLQEQNAERIDKLGGYVRTDEGLNERGRFCTRYDAPASAKDVYATRSEICVDPVTAIPLEMTNWDAKGLLERYQFRDLEPHAAEGSNAFALKTAGL